MSRWAGGERAGMSEEGGVSQYFRPIGIVPCRNRGLKRTRMGRSLKLTLLPRER